MEQSSNKQTGKWVAITASILTPLLVIAGLFLWIGYYAHNNPDSVIAYIFVRSGIDWFEPSYTDKKEPSALLGDFKSYESISNVQAQLKEMGLTGRITWPTNGPPEDGKARLLVKSFKVCEKSGDLSLFFLNDRLEETIFFPESTEPFLSTFKKQYSLSFDVTNAVHVSPHTIAELNFRTTKQDKKSKPVISFFDERLKREDNAWEMHRIAGKQ